jgi:hypothetical protein
MTERDLAPDLPDAAISTEPLPVQLLDYSGRVPKPSDPWRQIVNAFAVAAIVYGAAALLISGRHYMNAGWRELPKQLGYPDGINLAFLTTHLLGDLTSLGWLIAGVGCTRNWSWARRLMLISSIGALLAGLTELLLEALFTRGQPSLHYIMMMIPYYVSASVFPALLIWLMTRPEVREQFRRNKSPDAEASR